MSVLQETDLDEATNTLERVKSAVSKVRESFTNTKAEATRLAHKWNINSEFEAKL